MIPKGCKHLAEVDFPIAEVSKHAARQNYIPMAGAGGVEELGQLTLRRSWLMVAIDIKSC
jgi:hypothetical protein